MADTLWTQPEAAHTTAGVTVQAFDCTNPHHLQQYLPRENCSQTQRRPWSPPADFQILQYVETQRMPGYSCQLEVHTSVSYCGLWSYLKPVSSRTCTHLGEFCGIMAVPNKEK